MECNDIYDVHMNIFIREKSCNLNLYSLHIIVTWQMSDYQHIKMPISKLFWWSYFHDIDTCIMALLWSGILICLPSNVLVHRTSFQGHGPLDRCPIAIVALTTYEISKKATANIVMDQSSVILQLERMSTDGEFHLNI
jgi:hypothetical protein